MSWIKYGWRLHRHFSGVTSLVESIEVDLLDRRSPYHSVGLTPYGGVRVHEAHLQQREGGVERVW